MLNLLSHAISKVGIFSVFWRLSFSSMRLGPPFPFPSPEPFISPYNSRRYSALLADLILYVHLLPNQGRQQMIILLFCDAVWTPAPQLPTSLRHSSSFVMECPDCGSGVTEYVLEISSEICTNCGTLVQSSRDTLVDLSEPQTYDEGRAVVNDTIFSGEGKKGYSGRVQAVSESLHALYKSCAELSR